MKLRDTFERDGVQATILNTVRQDVRKTMFLDTWPKAERPTGMLYDVWITWVLVAGHSDNVQGCEWHPTDVMELDALRQNFDLFTDSVTPEVANAWLEAVERLRKPDASPLEKDDSQLSAQERNDPNSSKRGTNVKKNS